MPDETKGRTLTRTLLQAAGFALGVALFAWVVRNAWRQMGPEDWENLRGASALQVAVLIGLSSVSVAINGLTWWLALRPVQKTHPADTVSVNAVATVLALLPFKLSVVFRVLYHRRFDGVSLVRFGGWAVAFSAAMVTGLAPAIALSLTPLREHTGWWIVAVLFGSLGAAVVVSGVSRFFATGSGWRALRRAIVRAGGRRGVRLIRSRAFNDLHASVHMLASTPTLASSVGLRLADAFGISARFLVAAAVLGADLTLRDALVAGACFFVIGAVAPTGSVGPREGAVAVLFSTLGLQGMAPVIVFVTATQVLGELLAALAAGLWLGPRRLAGLSTARHEAEHAATLSIEKARTGR